MITVDEYSSTKVPWYLARYSSTRVLYYNYKIVLPTQLCCCDRESVDSPPSWNKSQKTRTTLSYMKVQVHVDLSVQSDYRICLYHSDQKLSNMPLIRKYWAKFNTEPQYHVKLAKTCRSCMASGMTIMSIRNQYKIIHCSEINTIMSSSRFSIKLCICVPWPGSTIYRVRSQNEAKTRNATLAKSDRRRSNAKRKSSNEAKVPRPRNCAKTGVKVRNSDLYS
jgi:hypothetical protein